MLPVSTRGYRQVPSGKHRGGTPRRLTFDGGREGSVSPDGKWLVYVRGFNSTYWDNYTGSANYDIYLVPMAGGTPKRLTKTDGNEHYPFFSKDGKTIYFVAEEGGVANFYAMPTEGGEARQVTSWEGLDVQRPDLSWDGKTVVFERGGKLCWTDLEKPGKEPTQIPLKVNSDVRNSGIETRTITEGGEHVSVSSDGTRLAFSLRGDIWIMASSGGEATRITEGPANDQWPKFSPDGSKIAYFSNAKDNNDLFVIDLSSRKVTQVTKHKSDDMFHNWSPDGKSLVFCSERSGNRDIWVIELETGTARQITKHQGGDDDPCFSPDGKLIAFDSGRAGTQAIYVCDVNGENIRRVTPGSGFLQVPCFSPDGQMLVYEAFQPGSNESGGLFVISVQGGPSMQISRDGQTACWSPRGDFIYFAAKRRAGEGVYRVRAPESVEAGERVPFIGKVTVELRKELAQLFDEAWNALGNGFYDTKMHGVDWKAMRKKYRPMAIDAENKIEFQNIVRQMLAELGASHLGIWGGASAGNSVTPQVAQTGYLGLQFEESAEKSGGFKVKDVLRGGPADAAGLRVGDIVLGLGNTKLTAETNLDKVLAGVVGKELPLIFRPTSEDGLGTPRRASIKPASFGRIRAIKARNWERTCIQRVGQSTKGRIAYIHLSAMNSQNLQKFQQTIARLNRSRRVKGLIIDVRNNGGGNIHNQLMQVLWAKPLAKVKVRGRRAAPQPALYWDRPVVCLINERSFSDAEVFPYMFKTAGIGKVIGVPTAGGVIGTVNITLSDGSSFRIPRSGFMGMDGTNLEGLGVKPDVLVEETSEDRISGRDPQLKKAIEVLIGEIREQARKRTEKGKRKRPQLSEAEAGRPDAGAAPLLLEPRKTASELLKGGKDGKDGKDDEKVDNEGKGESKKAKPGPRRKKATLWLEGDWIHQPN